MTTRTPGPTPRLQPAGSVDWLPWLALAIGLLALYVPTFMTLARTVWSSEDQSHGPIVLLMLLWLIWQKRDQVQWDAGRRRAGGAMFGIGLLLYYFGSSQSIIQFEVFSLIPVGWGLLRLQGGRLPFARAVLLLMFMLFLVPLPGVLVQAITLPLKSAVSYVVDAVLYALGYPMGRSGVTLTIGQYQLLVADACAGLNSIFVLEALGFFYMNLANHRGFWRNTILAVSIVPISFLANVIRVITLVLITYYFGDRAAQSFLHGFAGMVLFVVALTLIMLYDGLLAWLFERRRRVAHA